MGLPHLPPELLSMIASYLMPYDFENLSLTCKKAYQWAWPLLPRHNEYRRKYRNFSFESSSLVTIYHLLAVIADDPVIATYMVHVDLDGQIHYRDDDMDNAYHVERITRRLAPLVLGSPHLSMLRDDFDEPAELWLQGIVRDLEHYKRRGIFADFSVPFLATLLVNVETLILPEEWCDCCTIADLGSGGYMVASLLRLLVTRANDKSLKDQPLQKLRAIRPARGNIDGNVAEMKRLFPFLSLDSLKELHHRSGIFPWNYDKRAVATLGRNLEVMRLESYDIAGDCARLFFKDMHKLRVLEVEYSTTDLHDDVFHAELFMCSVITGTFMSLEKLVLTAVRFGYIWVLDCSLRECTRLKHLELGTEFLVDGLSGPDVYELETSDKEDEEDDVYMNARKAKHAIPERCVLLPFLGAGFHPDDKPKMYKNGTRVWRLVSVLPESLETLIIHTPAESKNSACVEHMFWRFEKLRPQRLPNLKRIELLVRTKNLSDARIDCRKQVEWLENFFADKNILTKFEIEV